MGPTDSTAKLRAVQRPDRCAVGPNDSTAELFAIERPDRGADSAKADVPADPRLQPYVPRDLQADGRGDRGAELRTIERAYISADGRGDRGAELRDVGPHDCAAKLRTVEIAHSGALDAADARAEL